MGSLYCNDVSSNLVAYSEDMIARYSPALQDGVWLPSRNYQDHTAKPAVLSADIGLKVGDTVEVNLPGKKNVRINVIGILEEPTQYLFPSGSASSPIFSAKSIIDQYPVVIMKDCDVGDRAHLVPPQGSVPENLFIFLTTDTQVNDALLDPWRKYGELTPMASLISTYNEDAKTMIGGGVVFFVVFFFLAVTCVISNQVIQSISNRKEFTIYYLAGMDWKMAAIIEGLRIVALVVIIIALTFVAGDFNLLMLEWMTPRRTILFYSITFVYIIAMFVGISVGFLAKLVRSDISVSLKDLQHGQ